jgi:hypothetical protein
MDTVHISGLVEGASGATIFITVAGPGHYSFSHSYSGSFDLPLPVQPGRFDIVVSADTEGKFTLDATGSYKSIKPDVPFEFKTKRKAFTLMV